MAWPRQPGPFYVPADAKLADAVWSYPQADGDSAAISGYLSFLHDEITAEAGAPGEPA
jgi:uncharacterized protein (DUF427 family)